MQAFQAAWGAACKVEGSTVLVPSEYDFLVGPISFSGPYCQPNIVFQVTIVFRVTGAVCVREDPVKSNGQIKVAVVPCTAVGRHRHRSDECQGVGLRPPAMARVHQAQGHHHPRQGRHRGAGGRLVEPVAVRTRTRMPPPPPSSTRRTKRSHMHMPSGLRPFLFPHGVVRVLPFALQISSTLFGKMPHIKPTVRNSVPCPSPAKSCTGHLRLLGVPALTMTTSV